MQAVLNHIVNSDLLGKAVKSQTANELNKAIAYYEALILNNEKNYNAYFSLGALYEKVHNEYKAIDTYKKGMQMARENNHKIYEKEFSYTILGLIE